MLNNVRIYLSEGVFTYGKVYEEIIRSKTCHKHFPKLYFFKKRENMYSTYFSSLF